MTRNQAPWSVCVAMLFAVISGCSGDEPAKPENTAPIASFTVNPATGTTSTNFQIDASGSSDSEDAVSVLQVRWDWENDGAWDTGFLTTKTASLQYGTMGTKTIGLEVRDTGGLAGNTTRTITVTHRVPVSGSVVLVPAGTFTMGDGEAYCGRDQREVTLTHSFYLGQFEVTNQEYRDALQWAYEDGHIIATSSEVSDNLDHGTAVLVHLEYGEVSFVEDTFAVNAGKEEHPMVGVTWFGAAAYCDWLSMGEGLTRAYDHSTWQCNGGDPYGAVGYRLPTDAEWEFAARYDDDRIYPWGNESPDCSRANFYDHDQYCVGSTSPVGSYPAAPVALALFDMAGNVWEWCNDWHVCGLGASPVSNPPGPTGGSSRVLHGGSWHFRSVKPRSAYRFGLVPGSAWVDQGFRCARSL